MMVARWLCGGVRLKEPVVSPRANTDAQAASMLPRQITQGRPGFIAQLLQFLAGLFPLAAEMLSLKRLHVDVQPSIRA
jgi:hypothetical protein